MTIIRAGTLIDGTGAPPVRDALVTIEGGRIEAVTTGGSSGSRPPGGEVIDATGLTVLPGLIDCHDHLAFHGYDLARRWGLDEPRSAANLRTSAVARRVLESGYTAVRDAGGLDAGFRVALNDGLIVGPRLVLSLAIISPTGGLGDRVSPSGQRRSEPSPERRRRHRRHPHDRAHDGPCRGGPDQVRHDRRRQLARRARSARLRVHARGDEGAGRRGARARAAGHVSRARRAGAPRGDRGGRRLDRARLLPGRGPRAHPDDGRARHLLRPDAARLRVPPRVDGAARARARARPARAPSR